MYIDINLNTIADEDTSVNIVNKQKPKLTVQQCIRQEPRGTENHNTKRNKNSFQGKNGPLKSKEDCLIKKPIKHVENEEVNMIPRTQHMVNNATDATNTITMSLHAYHKKKTLKKLNTAEISDNTSKKLLIATKGPSWW